MGSAVCTLFEGNYHYGVAALVNSLYTNGYRGRVYAGYRGDLPFWATDIRPVLFSDYEASLLQLADGLELVFIPLSTDYHLTNYKPNFMLDVLSWSAGRADSVAYFDPDIIVKCKWDFFEDWMKAGVALVHEITSNDMPSTHPLRHKWEKVIHRSNKVVRRNLNAYINGGFLGVHIRHKEYLETLVEIMQSAFTHFNLTPGQFKHNYDRTYEFYGQDQDAINIAAMCCESPLSEMGPEAMDFTNGGWTMSHAVGSPKPWTKNYLLSALQGITPSMTDKQYWKYANVIIAPYHKNIVSLKLLSIKIVSFIGRFYRKY